jgi:Cd2+/Zn2+-exporting ATPase
VSAPAATPTATPTAAACGRCAIHAESVFHVEGMCCGEEAAILQRRLGPLPGMEDVSADVVGGKLYVKYDAARLSPGRIADAVNETGMRAWLEHEEPVVAPTTRVRGLLVGASAAALALGFALDAAGVPAPWAPALFVAAAVAGGAYPFTRALASLRGATLDIHVLMLVAVLGALALGEWAEAATVVFLFSVAQWLETRTMDRARDAIRALMDLAPVEARIRHGNHEHTLKVEAVEPGALAVVRPGEKFPLDGVVVSGRSEVNQAPITGESLPVEKGPGDEVYAGTINGHGAMEVRVTRRVRDTTLARIIHLVGTAQAQRAPSQQLVDRFARWYTPAVVIGAALVVAVPVLGFGAPFDTWFYRALVLLVISCPCALVISTPVSIVSALAGAARRGVLVKGGAHLERLAAVTAVAFDKTGTLTHGELEVAAVVPLAGWTEADVLRAAAAVERRSEHPIARAVVTAAAARGVGVDLADDVVAIPGLGAEGRWLGRHVVAGNRRLAGERGLLTVEVERALAAHAAEGHTSVVVGAGGVAVGVVAVADRPRAIAADVVALLRQQGVAHVAMLTGDGEAAAHAVAARAGVDVVRAGLLPADKVAAVRELRARYGAVAMVGDGVNDAPALAAADVGIVMGAIGSDAALETADVALMTDELQKIPYALRLSRATLRNIRVNVAISVGLKAVFLAMALGGVATLWMAVLADTGASILVVANALRLLRAR